MAKSTLRERAQMWLDAHMGPIFDPEIVDPMYLTLKLLQTLDAIESIRDSDPDAYRAIVREMGDGDA